MKNINKLFFVVSAFLCVIANAQMPHDAIYMRKQSVCLAVSYSNNSWKEYWENTLKRENFNIGTLTTQSVMPMLAVGITNDFNVIAALPYIKTSTSAGNLMGQKGLQDASLWLKYRFFKNDKGLSLQGIVGGSMPASNYVPDFLPMSIGLQAKSATGRLLVNYKHKTGIYLTAHASYMIRSKIHVDRDSYLSYSKVYNTNEVAVPNATDVAARLGYLKKGIQAEVFLERFACVSGDEIRRNDMPFPTNKMEMNNVGAYVKYQPKNIGVNARVNYVLNGLNVGQTFGYSVGLLFQFNNIKL